MIKYYLDFIPYTRSTRNLIESWGSSNRYEDFILTLNGNEINNSNKLYIMNVST